jgi:drug/metabolite transporter (DMT)-like permease
VSPAKGHGVKQASPGRDQDSPAPANPYHAGKKGRGMTYATGAGLVFLAGLVWSVQGLLIRFIENAGPWEILFWRSAGMVPVLLIWIWFSARRQTLAQIIAVGWPGLIGGMGLVAAFSGAIYSFQTTSVANAVLLFTASPFFAALLGRVLLGEAVSALTWFAIGLAILGVGVMVGGGIAGGTLIGNVAALLSALGFAVFSVALRWRHLANMLPAILLGGLLAMAAGAIGTGLSGLTLLVPARDVAIALGMGAGTLAGGLILYTIGSRAVPAAQATLISLVEVLLAPVWAWAFLGEITTTGTLIGGAVLLAAVILNAYGGRRAMGAG